MSPVKQKTSKEIVALAMVASVLFATGWLTGRHGPSWNVVKQAITDSYVNRYRVMSDSNLTSIVYYVSTKDPQALHAMANTTDDILKVSSTRIKDLYDVTIQYAARVPTVKTLRAMKNVDAVITIPMICH